MYTNERFQNIVNHSKDLYRIEKEKYEKTQESYTKILNEIVFWLPGYPYYKNDYLMREKLSLIHPDRISNQDENEMPENDFIYYGDIKRLLEVLNLKQTAKTKLEESNAKVRSLQNDLSIMKMKYEKIENEYKALIKDNYLKSNKISELSETIQKYIENEHQLLKKKTQNEENWKLIQTDEIDEFLSMIDEAKDYLKSKQRMRRLDNEMLEFVIMKRIENWNLYTQYPQIKIDIINLLKKYSDIDSVSK